MKSLVLSGVFFLALAFGTMAALLGGVPALVVSVLVAPLLLLLADYRVGVVALTIVLPWVPLLPHQQGLNAVNYLILLTLITLIVPKMLKRQAVVGVPRAVVWLYLVPVCIGMAVAWRHIPEAGYNFAGTDLAMNYTQVEFLKNRFLKPLGWVIYAVLLANAVRDSRKPERWLIALAVSALIPAAIVFIGVAVHGGNLEALQGARGFLSAYGMHANGFGLLLMTACVPLLWLVVETRGKARLAYGFVCGVTALALVLTFSRGAWLAFAAALAVFVFTHRPLRTILVLIPLVVLAAIVAPQAIIDRVTTGFGERAESVLHSRSDELTAGRVASWRLLAPEVARSPIVGRGIGSTAWSQPVANRTYVHIHPHNMFLAIAMDLGIAGLACMLALYAIYLRAFRRLARDPKLDPLMRAFFAGAAASLVGVLTMGLTNGDFMPSGEQTFYWFSLGMLYAHWRRARELAGAPGMMSVARRAGVAAWQRQPAGRAALRRRPAIWTPPRGHSS
jgi:O-antigen ligase